MKRKLATLVGSARTRLMLRIIVGACVSLLVIAGAIPLFAQQPASAGSADESAVSAAVGETLSGTGTTDFIPLWINSTTLGNSALFQLGTGTTAKVGIGTTTPKSTLDVKGGATIRGLFSLPNTGTATATAGFNSEPMNLAASVFNSSASVAVTQTFQWRAEPVGNDTATATGSLNLLFGEGTTKPAETGLNIASNGAVAATSFSGNGSGLTNVTAANSNELGGLAPSAYQPAGSYATTGSNTFTGNQTVNGNVSVVGGVISVGGSRALSCTSLVKAIGSIPTGSASTYSFGSVAAPAGYSLTGCNAFWASSATCGTIQYPAAANITALNGIDGACHALGYNGSGGTLESCAEVTACQLP